MKKRRYKQLLASAIACSMVFSGVPATAYAAENGTVQEVVQEEDQSSTDSVSEDQSNAGQQENTENQDTEGTDKSETENNSQTEDSQEKKADTTQSDNVKTDAATQAAKDTKAAEAAKELEIHAGEKIKGDTLYSQLKAWFGTATKYRYTQGETKKEVSALNALTEYPFTSDSVTVEKYVNKGSLFKPNYVWETAGTFTVKNYYNATFNVTNILGAGVQVDGQDVTGDVKVYDTDARTFTVNPVEGYNVTVTVGSVNLEPVNGVYTVPTLTADTTINVVYEATAGVYVNVTNSDNGKITIDGQEVSSKKVGLNSTYTVNVTPDKGYAVENILVNGNPVEGVAYANQTATVTLPTGDVNDAEFIITAEIVQCKLDVKDAEVSYRDGLSVDTIAQNIFKAVVGTGNVPEITLNDVTIEYDASLTGLGNWKPLGYQPEWYEPTLHTFGKGTEKIRITYKGTDKYPAMSETATITLKDLREETVLTIQDGITMQYQSAEMMDAVIKVLIAQNATVTDKNGNVIDTTADDFTYTPSTDEWKAGEQEIAVTYNGNEDYLSSSATTTITIKKGDANVWVNSQNIKYGESFSQVFASDPADAVPLGMIVGIDGNGKSFVGLDTSNVVIKEKIPVIGTEIEVPLENAILTLVPSGKIKVGNLMTIINKIPDLGDNAGVISAIQKVVDTVLKIYPAAEDLEISFKRPTESGVYLAVGASTSQNYKTAVGVGYLTIMPQTKNVKLEFNNQLPDNNTFTYQEAQSFEFGGKATQDGQVVSANVKAKYSGVTAGGKIIALSNTPLIDPGSYIETIYMVGGNYIATPIIRSYTVEKAVTEIQFVEVDSEVPYDGQPHGVTADVYCGEERIADADIIYMNSSGYKSADEPTDAGMYQVMASYKGDAKYAGVDAKYTTLTITKKEVTITPNAQTPVYFRDQLPEFTYTVTDAAGELSEEEIATIGTISVVRDSDAVTPGTYTLTAQIENANKNYNITCATSTFEILRRPIKIQTTDISVEYGDDVPDVDYYIYDMDGALASTEIVNVSEDFPELAFSIQGQEDGKHLAANDTYAIEISGAENENFVVEYVAGKLTVNPRRINISIDSKKKVEGEVDPELTYTATRVQSEPVTQTADATTVSAVVEGDDLGVALTRESGETPGLYDISANTEQLNANYELVESPDGTDKFEIAKKGTVITDDKGSSNKNPSAKTDNTKKDNTKSKSTKTGDTSNMLSYLFMMEIALVAAFVTLIVRRRRRR